MQDQHRVIVLAKACAVVGIVLALHGAIADRSTTWRAGLLTLVSSIGVSIHLTSRYNTQKLMEHQAQTARLTARERQQYAQMGWNAHAIDALTEEPSETAGDAEVIRLPHARNNPQMRRNGSA
ncbi:hypothetical protein ABZ330_21515 [Streptomyces sp. NPDC006172]|uniref:hypothetical protein n=1 Tax=Streptomyces sp. NPDC006172 TaxID=3154470 RepID=UPI00340F1298